MVGLVILLILLVVAGFSIVSGVDSREDFTDPRWPHSPVGLS